MVEPPTVMEGVVIALVFVNFTFNVVPATKSLEVNYGQVTTFAAVLPTVLQVP